MTARPAAVAALLLLGGGATPDAVAAQKAAAAQDAVAPAETPAAPARSDAVAAQPIAREPEAPAAKPAAPARTATPAAPQRKAPAAPEKPTAVIAVLDKRLGTTAEFTLTPGQTFQFGRISGIMQSCERTQPFERKQSAAFVQVTEQPVQLQGQAKPAPRRVFSGWLFAESPSLNPFVHPVYDVWLRSCAMRFPDGPKPPASTVRRPARKPAASATPEPAAE